MCEISGRLIKLYVCYRIINWFFSTRNSVKTIFWKAGGFYSSWIRVDISTWSHSCIMSIQKFFSTLSLTEKYPSVQRLWYVQLPLLFIPGWLLCLYMAQSPIESKVICYCLRAKRQNLYTPTSTTNSSWITFLSQFTIIVRAQPVVLII